MQFIAAKFYGNASSIQSYREFPQSSYSEYSMSIIVNALWVWSIGIHAASLADCVL